MGKGWSVLFGVVLLAEGLLCVVSVFIPGWWLPPNASTFGGDVDFLYYVILGLTGFFFVLTEVILVWNMWVYAEVPGHKSTYTHGNHRLEMFWTAVPAAILLYIAIAQISTWARIKYASNFPHEGPDVQIAQVTGRQWEWRIRHPGPDNINFANAATARAWAESPQADDVHLGNEFHTWEGAKVKLYLKTNDVIHSFFLPNLRLKQDALPGKTIPVWFQVMQDKDEDGNLTHKFVNIKRVPGTDTWIYDDTVEKKTGATMELACAELCGSRHYAMRGRLFVHKDKEDYLAWLAATLKAQKGTQPTSAVASSER